MRVVTAFDPFYNWYVGKQDLGWFESEMAATVESIGADPLAARRCARSLVAGLLGVLERQVTRCLIAEFHAFRHQQMLPLDPASSRALEAFTERLGGSAHNEALVARYPLMDRRAGLACRNYAAAQRELLARFVADREAMERAGMLAATSRLAMIDPTDGDLHNSGRSVLRLSMTDGVRIFYKPRSLASDQFLRNLFEGVEQHLKHSITGCVPVSIDRVTHGWQAFVESGPMADDTAPSRYYYRFGVLCALLGSIGASDIHNENLVANGEWPCIIDTETPLRPDADTGGPIGGCGSLRATLTGALPFTAASTMLVPMRQPDSPVDVVMAAVGLDRVQEGERQLALLADVASDAIRYQRTTVPFRHGTNLPRLEDTPLSVFAYLGDLADGYRDAMVAVRSRVVKSLLAASPPFPVRRILRPTMVYGHFLEATSHPDYLSDEEALSRVYGMLSPLTFMAQTGVVNSLVAVEERSALARGDIPYFAGLSTSTAVDDERVPVAGAFRRSPIDFALEGVSFAARQSDEFHLSLLEECLSELVDDPMTSMLKGSVFAHLALERAPGSWWPAVAEHLRASAVSFEAPDGPQSAWIMGIGPDYPTLLPATCLGFHDAGGMVSFLSRAAEADNLWAAAAESCRSGYRELVGERLTDGESLNPLLAAPESIFGGVASLLLVDEDLAETYAHLMSARLGMSEAEGVERERDLGNGPAGMLMLVLDRPDWLRRFGAHRVERLMHHLRRDLADVHGRSRRWFDLAHGELGLRWVAARAGSVMDDQALADQAADWLAGRLSEADLPTETGWCAGSAGLLLASAEIAAASGRHDLLPGRLVTRLVDHATSLPVDIRPLDVSVCHGSSGVVQALLATAGLLGDPALIARAAAYQDSALRWIGRHGARTGVAVKVSLLGYMLGWAGVGDTDLLLQQALDGAVERPVPLSLRTQSSSLSVM